MIMYHATRLTDEEIVDVKKNGLRILSAAGLLARIDRVADAGLISRHVAQLLKAKHWADKDSRAGLLAFCTRDQLADGHGIGWFVNFWGGEALTMHHAQDEVTGPILWNLGTAVIVELDREQGSDDVMRRSRNGVPAHKIRAIHRFGEPGFEELSQSSKWPDRFKLDRPADADAGAWAQRFAITR